MADMIKLTEAMGDLEEELVLSIVQEVVDHCQAQVNDAVDACQKGMNIVGERFDSGEYFVADLIFAGEIMTKAFDLLKPVIASESGNKVGRLILCTVEGDLHDIGKNIVKAMLEAAGFDVVDLGIDVPADKIIQTVKAEGINIVALSGVLTLAIDSMKKIVGALSEAGVRDNVKIIIGGAPITAEMCKFVTADDWAINPQKTVNICRQWSASV